MRIVQKQRLRVTMLLWELFPVVIVEVIFGLVKMNCWQQ